MADMEVQKRVKNCVLYTNGCIRIDGVRGSYVHLDKPYKGKDDDASVAKYSIVGLLPKETHEAARKLIDEAIGNLLKANKNAKVASSKRFIQDGDESGRAEYEDHWSVSAREERKVKCRDAEGELIEDNEDIREMFRSGYWFSILIRPWFQDNKYGKRVNAGLVAVKFVKEDEEFGEGSIDDGDAWGDDDDDKPARKGGSSKSKSKGRRDADDGDDDDDDDI